MPTVVLWKTQDGETVKLRPSIVVGGIDFGFTNPTALEVGLKLGRLWLNTWEWYDTRATSVGILKAVGEATRRFGVMRWWADSEDPREIANLQTRELPVLANEIHDLDFGIRTVYGLMKRRVKHPVLGEGPLFRIGKKQCPNLSREMGLYSLPTVKGEVATWRPPIDRHNHAIAAARYYLTNEGEMPAEEEAPHPSERPTMFVDDEGRYHDDPAAHQAKLLGPRQEEGGWYDEVIGGDPNFVVVED